MKKSILRKLRTVLLLSGLFIIYGCQERNIQVPDQTPEIACAIDRAMIERALGEMQLDIRVYETL